MAAPLCVQLEFGGGAELLFNGVRKHQVTLAGQSEPFASSPPRSTFLSLAKRFAGDVILRRGRAYRRTTVKVLVELKGDVRHLLVWIKENLLKERPELFVQGDSVRPGILVLINDTDWELMGELDYQLQDQDNVVFISTLHGG